MHNACTIPVDLFGIGVGQGLQGFPLVFLSCGILVDVFIHSLPFGVVGFPQLGLVLDEGFGPFLFEGAFEFVFGVLKDCMPCLPW